MKILALATLVLASVVVIAGLSILFGGADIQAQQPEPARIPVRPVAEVPTPPDERKVAIVTVRLLTVAPDKVSGEVKDVRTVRSYAPNVFDKAGPWTVELVGSEQIKYGVLDPRQVHIFDAGDKMAHGQELVRDVTWELVVPLFKDGQDLKVTLIKVFDQQGTLIFQTPPEDLR